ncbi:hypothetical protein PENTCL1PPCAC_27755, partial [Pristionchus entomophagus]
RVASDFSSPPLAPPSPLIRTALRRILRTRRRRERRTEWRGARTVDAWRRTDRARSRQSCGHRRGGGVASIDVLPLDRCDRLDSRPLRCHRVLLYVVIGGGSTLKSAHHPPFHLQHTESRMAVYGRQQSSVQVCGVHADRPFLLHRLHLRVDLHRSIFRYDEASSLSGPIPHEMQVLDSLLVDYFDPHMRSNRLCTNAGGIRGRSGVVRAQLVGHLGLLIHSPSVGVRSNSRHSLQHGLQSDQSHEESTRVGRFAKSDHRDRSQLRPHHFCDGRLCFELVASIGSEDLRSFLSSTIGSDGGNITGFLHLHLACHRRSLIQIPLLHVLQSHLQEIVSSVYLLLLLVLFLLSQSSRLSNSLRIRQHVHLLVSMTIRGVR